ncbi:MAG: transcriptional regulator, putative ATPase, winged helix family [Steroidobacteraceae bacterium]|nr:transcriptional regulator, putative ATPase, winged helix family [Steroidobacteraceae bacterium]
MAPSTPVRLRFEAFELDEANARLLRNGQIASLAPKPFALLCELVRRQGALCTKQTLLDNVWGHQFGYRFIAPVTPIPATSPHVANAAGIVMPRAASFVGREVELTRLHRAWDQACSGKRSVVWVVGEPGIGKTALIEHFVASLGDVACAHGQCVEYYGAGEPYLPVLEALAELCKIDGSVPDLLRAVAPAWLMQLPWLCTADERDALRRELSGVGPERMLREMGEVLDRIVDRRPLLLVTEDLHWSDRATIQLVDYIARRRGSARLMWLSSFRLAEVVALEHPLSPVRRELRLHSLCTEVVLDPFSEAEVAACIATQSRSLAGDDVFVRALHDRTDGVPLFIVSILRDVLSQAELDAQAARVVASAVPANVAAIIDHYVARLSADQRQLLTAAAICGSEFRISTVADVLGREAATVESACEELARERLWLAPPHSQTDGGRLAPPYAFSHALFRHVLYEGTPPLARARLHGAVAEALERERLADVPVAAAELAMHFERSQDRLRSLRYYIEAADTALLHLSPAECMALTERALTLLEGASARPQYAATELTLCTLRGVASFHLLGVDDETRGAFQNAYALLDRVPDHPMRGLLLHGIGYVHCLRTEFEQALAVAERAVALSPSSDDPMVLLASCTIQGEVNMLRGKPLEARIWLERGLSLLDRIDETVGRVFAADPTVTLLAMLGLQLLHLGLVKQGRARVVEANACAGRLGQPTSRMVAMWYEALFELRLDNVERVAALADEMSALAEEFALAHARTASRWFSGWAGARSGAPLEGYRRIREAHENNVRLGMVAGASENLGYAAEALLLSGDWQAAQQQLDEATTIAHRSGELIYQPQLSVLEAAIARARGDDEGAGATLRRAVAEARAQSAPWLELLALLALCESSYDTDADRAELATIVGQLPEATETGPVTRAHAVLARASHT